MTQGISPPRAALPYVSAEVPSHRTVVGGGADPCPRPSENLPEAPTGATPGTASPEVTGPEPALRGGAAVAPGTASQDSEVGEPTPRHLVGFECSLETASLDQLDHLHRILDERWVEERFRGSIETEEVTRLATCHRIEIYLIVRSEGEPLRWRRELPGDPAIWRVRTGRELVRHLYRVANGRDSLALGEREIRFQVRAAGHTTRSRDPRPFLPELFEEAAAAADELSPSVPPEQSVASIAVAHLVELVRRPNPRALVIGAGTVGRQVAEQLAPSAQVTIAYRHRSPDEEFLRRTGARAVPFDALRPELSTADVVVTATKSGRGFLGPSDLAPARPVLLVDLGVPRNIDPAVRELPHVRLVDLEELRAISRTESVPPEDPRLMALADQSAEWWESRALEPWVDELRRRAEELRRSEVELARTFLGPLRPEQEVAVERLTRRIVARLLIGSTEKLRSLPPGTEADRLRRFALELLRPTDIGD